MEKRSKNLGEFTINFYSEFGGIFHIFQRDYEKNQRQLIKRITISPSKYMLIRKFGNFS